MGKRLLQAADGDGGGPRTPLASLFPLRGCPFFLFGMRRGLRWTAVLFVLLVGVSSSFYEQARFTARAETCNGVGGDALRGSCRCAVLDGYSITISVGEAEV